MNTLNAIRAAASLTGFVLVLVALREDARQLPKMPPSAPPLAPPV